jgi:hypothetical protein
MTTTVSITDAPEAQAMVLLERMIALSATFETAVPVYDDRLSRVWFEDVPNEKLAQKESSLHSTVDLPFASVWPHQTGWSAIAGGNQNHMIPRGTMHVYLMYPRPLAVDWREARIAAMKFLGNWQRDIIALSGADDSSPAITGSGHLCITLTDALPPEHVETKIRESAGDFFTRDFAINFGDGDSPGGGG